jgi:uncharacterized Zn finger protein
MKVKTFTISCPGCGRDLVINTGKEMNECENCGVEIKTMAPDTEENIEFLNNKKILAISELSFLAMKFMKSLGLLEEFKQYVKDDEAFKEDLFFMQALITSFEVSEYMSEMMDKP